MSIHDVSTASALSTKPTNEFTALEDGQTRLMVKTIGCKVNITDDVDCVPPRINLHQIDGGDMLGQQLDANMFRERHQAARDSMATWQNAQKQLKAAQQVK